MNCIFCQIIHGEIPSEIIFENEEIVVFKDIHPKAETHFLIVPKKHIESVNHLEKSDINLMGQMILIAKDAAQKFGIKNGYKLVFNVGRGGGQLVDHIHLHFLSGPPRLDSSSALPSLKQGERVEAGEKIEMP